jgi:tetratricopeptide (TPR) repeat protein
MLIKGASVGAWIKEIQRMGLSLPALSAYPVPSTQANVLWGCLLVLDAGTSQIDLGRNTYCQVVNQILFIPERSHLYPLLSHGEVEQLFSGKKHLLHPEFGLVALEEEIDWKNLVEWPVERSCKVTAPSASVFIPGQIKSFQIKPLAPEEVLDTFEEKYFPKPEAFKEKPLNPLEKVKLFFYKQVFKLAASAVGGSATGKAAAGPVQQFLNKWFSGRWSEKLQMDFESLEKRNQKHLDRLMDLFKKNPGEALKYAIPLDTDGTGRGGAMGAFSLQKRWLDLSAFGRGWNSGGAGAAIMPGNSFAQLHAQYLNTAQELTRQKDYQKAAFVYMKLLKNYHMAAQTLEQGGYYQESASLYLKYCSNKQKAAECYEKGNMTENAIELYKELNQDEKVGDLYYALHQKKEALVYYQKVADGYTQNQQFVKAALLYKNKMENTASAQGVLLKGWRLNRDGFNCLNNYFSNISDPKQSWSELQEIYHKEVNGANRETFLKVLQYEYDKQNDYSESIKDMAYQVVAEQVGLNPSIVLELRTFNKNDKELVKDTVRFKINLKK